MASLFATILAFLRGLPALAKIVDTIAGLLRDGATRLRESSASERRVAKDVAVDSGINAVFVRESETEQQPTIDGTPGLPGGGKSGPGVGAGQPENNQPA